LPQSVLRLRMILTVAVRLTCPRLIARVGLREISPTSQSLLAQNFDAAARRLRWACATDASRFCPIHGRWPRARNPAANSPDRAKQLAVHRREKGSCTVRPNQ